MDKKQVIEALIAEVLDGTELRLTVDSYTLNDNLETGEVAIHCEMHDARTGEKKSVDGTGVGMADAFFKSLVEMYSGDFPSLRTIRFADFSVKAHMDSSRSARSDSRAHVTVRIASSEGREFAFEDSSPSITRSSIKTVLLGIEFFINGERAFIQVHRAMQHARERNRPDSVARYTAQLATLAGVASYGDVIEQNPQG